MARKCACGRGLSLSMLAVFSLGTLPAVGAAEVPRRNDLPMYGGAAVLAQSVAPPPAALEPVVELEGVNVTASRRVRSDLSTPQALTVISKEEIDRRRARANTLAELLNTVPNFSQTFSGGRFVSQPRLRGGLGGRGSQSGLVVLVDGVRRNNTNGTEDYLLDFPVDQIERIEVLRGPASVLYGTEAVDGVINLITRREQPEQPARLGVRLDVGSAGTVRTAVSFAGKADSLAYQLRYSTQTVDDYTDASGTAQVRDRFSGQSYLARVRYDFNAVSDLEFEFVGSRAQNVFLPIVASGATLFDFSFPYRNRDQYALTYRNRDLLSSDFTARVYYTGFERNFRNNIFAVTGNTTIATSVQDQRPILTSLGGVAQFVSAVGDTRITWGLDAYRENYSNNDLELTGGRPDGTPQRPSGSQNNVALFAQAAVPLAQGLNLTAGLRWDNYRQEAGATPLNSLCPLPFIPPGVPCPVPVTPSSFPGSERTTSEVIPAIGLTWQFEPGFALRGNYSRAIRNPNFFELYGGPQSVGVTQGNPVLATERSETYDVGLRVRRNRLQLDLGYFVSNYDNKIVTQPLPGTGGLVLFPTNARRVQGYGYEAEGSWEVFERWTLFGSYGSVTAYDQQTNTRLPQVLPATASVGLRYREPSGLYAQVILRNIPDYFVTAPAGQGNGFTVVDLDFGLPLNGATRLALGVNNLTNALYREAFTSFNAPGLQVFGSLFTEF